MRLGVRGAVVGPGSAAPSPALRRAREIARWEGRSALLHRLLAHLGVRRVGWWARPLDASLGALADAALAPGRDASFGAPPADGRPRARGWELVELAAGDVERYLALRRGATRSQFAERLAAGYRAWALAASAPDGALGTVAWVARERGWLAFLALPLPLAPGETYVFDTYTSPALRGRGLQPALLAAVLAAAQRSGATRASAAIEPHNRPSVRAFERLGFRRVGTLASFGIGRLRRVVRRGEVPR